MAIDLDKIKKAQERLNKHKGGNNLNMIKSSDRARELQKRSVESRKRNKERVELLKSFWEDFDKAGLKIGEDKAQGVDVLDFLLKKAIHDEDFEAAERIAGTIAQYQTPKKASIHQTNTEVDLKDLTDEEFEELKRELE